MLVLLVLGFFSIGRAASTQQRWDWTLPHPEHTQLVWLWSVPQVPQKDKRTVVPHTHVLCTLVRSFPTSKSCRHLRDWEHKGGCSARSHYLHNTDSQDYWGGRAPLGITKSNPLPKSRAPQRRLLRAMSRWDLMISKKCSITYYISYLSSVITLITNRRLWFLFFFFFLVLPFIVFNAYILQESLLE